MSVDPGAGLPSSQAQPAASSRSRWRSLLLSRRFWLGMLFGGICLAVALIDLDWGQMIQALRAANPGWIALAAGSVLLTSWAKVWRWRLLLYPPSSHQAAPRERPGSKLSLPRLATIWLAGTGTNLALPAPRAGDVLRIYLTSVAGKLSKSSVLGTVAAEKLLDMVLLALCFPLLIFFVAAPQELAGRQASTVAAAAVLALGTALMLWQRERVIALATRVLRRVPFGRALADSLARGLQGLDALRRPSSLLALAVASVAIWLLLVLTSYLIFLALDMPPSWGQSLFVFVVAQVGVALPSTPGKIGFFPVLCQWALGVFAVSSALGLAYGVLLYTVAPLLLMLLGAAALLFEGWRYGRLPADLDASLSAQP